MIKIRVIKAFSFAQDGIRIVQYAPGEQSVCARCAAIALAEGWAEEIKPSQNLRSTKKKRAKKK